MRFDADIYDNEVEREFGRFFEWTEEQTWRTKISKIEQSPGYSEADAYRQYLRHRNPLLVCVEQYFNLSRQGKTVAKHLDDEGKKICGYIKLLNRIAYQEGKDAPNRLKGSILDDESVKGFLFEID